MSIATVIDASTGRRIGVIVAIGLAPTDITGPTWRFIAWRVLPDVLASEPLNPGDAMAHREDVYVEARYAGGDVLPELRVVGEQLDFIQRHPAFRTTDRFTDA